MGAMADQLATQGVIAQTRLKGGENALVFQVQVIDRYKTASMTRPRLIGSGRLSVSWISVSGR